MADSSLKLLALDAEDLAVISAHLQDAVVKVADLVFLPPERRFAFAANRFDWEASVVANENKRRRAAVHFERVTSVKSKGIPLEKKDVLLNLLAVAFEETNAPSGAVLLHFSGGACVRLEVECLEAAIKDIGPSWETKRCPKHELVEDA